MKKIMIQISMILLILLLSGCGKVKTNTGDNADVITPTLQPTTTAPTEAVQEDTKGNTSENAPKLIDYYPFTADTEYSYEGSGSEYAQYIRVTDFLDTANSRIQTRTNNGGSETVSVLEIKDGRLSVIKSLNECYYRDNIMTDAVAGEDAEVLLMEPLVQGTQWTLADGSKRSITAVDVAVTTPSGNYKAIEVTTENVNGNSKDYYAPQVGLVKSVYGSGDMEITSTLSEIKSDTPFIQNINIYYPDADEKIYAEPLTLSFKTGDDTKQVLQDAICKEASKDSYLPLASINTKINSLYLGKDNIVYADFSKELVSDMNAGSGYEQLILQSITNTLGSYYGVKEVMITMEGKAYESGHILMKKGETFKVDMDNVAK